MRLLIDTHIFIGACDDSSRLRPFEQAAISDPDNDVLVSAATAWEISIKHAHGTRDFPVQRFSEMASGLGFATLDMTPAHGLAAGALPLHHKNPFDRMIVAQCRLEDLVLVTHDRILHQYDVPILGLRRKPV